MTVNLTRKQFFIFLFVAQTGSVFISFQAPFINAAGRDAWLIFIIVSFLHYGLLLFYEYNYQYFQLGRFVSWAYKAYWLLLAVTFISYIDFTLAVWAFPKTPQAIVIFMMVGVSLYANLCRAETSVNFGVFLIPMVPLFIFFLMMAWSKFEWSYLFPIGESTRTQWLKGMLKAQYAFIGIEIFLIFRQYIDPSRIVKGKPLFFYHLIWTFFFLFTVIISQLFFSLEQLTFIPEPLMYILKSQHVTFVERLDLFFIYIWMSWSIITLTIISFTALYVHRMHYNMKHKRDTIIFHFILFLIPLFGLTKQSTEMLQSIIIYFHLVFAIALPIIIIFKNRRTVS